VWRRTASFGLNGEVGFGLGLRHTFFPGSVYRVDDAGDWSQVANTGQLHAVLTLRVGLGYDLDLAGRAVTPFVRVEPHLEAPCQLGMPFNLLTHLQLGVRVGLGTRAGGVR